MNNIYTIIDIVIPVLNNSNISEILIELLQGEEKENIEKNTKLVTVEGPTKKACSICLEEYIIGQQLRKTKCNHLFHVDCIDHWLERNNTCPNCRTRIY